MTQDTVTRIKLKINISCTVLIYNRYLKTFSSILTHPFEQKLYNYLVYLSIDVLVQVSIIYKLAELHVVFGMNYY